MIVASLLAQHVNLFEWNLVDYNFKLFFYISFIALLPVLTKLQNHIKFLNPVNNFGELNIVIFIYFLVAFSLFYFLFNLYENYTNLRKLIIGYYFTQKIITKNFKENKRAFLSIKSDISQNLKKFLINLSENLYLTFFLPLLSYDEYQVQLFIKQALFLQFIFITQMMYLHLQNLSASNR